MKHLFWIHSHTAFYTSLAAIEYLKLNDEDVLFLCDRGYQNKYFDYDFYDFSKFTNKLSPFTIKTAFCLSKIQKEFDDKINNIIDDTSFIAYIPHVAHPAFQILITHQKCCGYNFIEEGLANYIDKNYQGATFRTFSKIVNMLIVIYNYFNSRVILGHKIFGMYPKITYNPRYFLIDNDYHIKRKNQIMLTWQPHDVEMNIANQSVLLILGPTLEYNMANQDQFLVAIQKLLDQYKKEYPSFYIKYHPYNKQNTIHLIERLLDDNKINFQIIPDDEPIEQLLRNDNNLIVMGIDSSLLFYAKILNKKNTVISAYKQLLSIDKIYQERCSLKQIEEIFEDGIVIL